MGDILNQERLSCSSHRARGGNEEGLWERGRLLGTWEDPYEFIFSSN